MSYKDRQKKLECHLRYNLAHREERRILSREWRKKNKLRKELYDKEYNKKYPLRIKANLLLKQEIKMGRMKREKCRDCERLDTQGHHFDYSQPLNVIWLCPPHHKMEDSRMTKLG